MPQLVRAEMDRDTSEAERDRQAHRLAQRARGSAKQRSAAASFSHEETAHRRDQRNEGRGAATATKETRKHKAIALLYGEEAAEVMKTKPTRLPDLVLEGPHEASPAFHQDWTIVALPGSDRDPERWELGISFGTVGTG